MKGGHDPTQIGATSTDVGQRAAILPFTHSQEQRLVELAAPVLSL